MHYLIANCKYKQKKPFLDNKVEVPIAQGVYLNILALGLNLAGDCLHMGGNLWKKSLAVMDGYFSQNPRIIPKWVDFELVVGEKCENGIP